MTHTVLLHCPISAEIRTKEPIRFENFVIVMINNIISNQISITAIDFVCVGSLRHPEFRAQTSKPPGK